jgi:hypothetical protein
MLRLARACCTAGFFYAAFLVPFAKTENPPRGATMPALEQLRAGHQQVLDDLNGKGVGGRPLSLDDPRVPALLSRGWSLAGAWAAAYLETHPAPSTRELKWIFEGFAPKPRGIRSKYGNFLEYHDYSFTGSAVRIGVAVYVVQASYWMDTSTGTFIVVARNQDGHFQVLWNIKDLAEKHYAQRDEIGRWVYLVRRAYYNGPLDVRKTLPLRPAASGHARFLVDAFQSADGGTTLAQLSIWEWDGTAAKPLLVQLYQYAADLGGFRFDGRTLRISTKERLKTFSSCGMCPDPRGVWTVRITPGGVQDLGHRFLQPELQWADELLSKVNKGEDTTDLAEGKVVAALKARMQEEQGQDLAQDPSQKSEFYWGMLDQFHILRRGRRGEFELAMDEHQLWLSYVRRNGRHYFTAIRIQ